MSKAESGGAGTDVRGLEELVKDAKLPKPPSVVESYKKYLQSRDAYDRTLGKGPSRKASRKFGTT